MEVEYYIEFIDVSGLSVGSLGFEGDESCGLWRHVL
jgi:hypothetical protein